MNADTKNIERVTEKLFCADDLCRVLVDQIRQQTHPV